MSKKQDSPRKNMLLRRSFLATLGVGFVGLNGLFLTWRFGWYKSTFKVSFNGPFEPGQSISLKRTDNEIVKLLRCYVKQGGPDEITVSIQFKFMGPEVPTDVMLVRAELFGESGRELGTAEESCQDMRMYDNGSSPGTFRSAVIKVNQSTLNIPIRRKPVSFDEITQLKLAFTRMNAKEVVSVGELT